MTEEEFYNLNVGDTVYYYTEVNVTRMRTMTAALKKKKVGSINIAKDGSRYIAFEGSGVILKNILYLFDTDRDKLLYRKVKHIKKSIKEAYEKKRPFMADLDKVYNDLMQQKNLQPMLKKYPELLI